MKTIILSLYLLCSIVGCASGGSTHVTFNPVPTAVSYELLISTNSDMSNYAVTNYTTATDFIISNLPPGTNYVSVRALSDTAASDFTKPVPAVVPVIGTTTITLRPQ